MRHFTLSTAVLLEVSGADSARYLEARLTNKVKALSAGSGMLAAALNAQGKTQAFFSVYMLENARYLLQCDGGDRAEVLQAAKQFIVADRVGVQDLSDQYRLLRVFAGEELAMLFDKLGLQNRFAAGIACVQSDLGFVCVRSRGAEFVVDLACNAGALSRAESILTDLHSQVLDQADYLLERLKFGDMAFPLEIQVDALFAEAAPPDSVSYNKGCYVGQEVMEKVASLGKLARRVRRLGVKGRIELRPGEEVFADDQASGANTSNIALGKVLSSAYDPDQNMTLCFALLRNQGGIEQVRIKNQIAKIL